MKIEIVFVHENRRLVYSSKPTVANLLRRTKMKNVGNSKIHMKYVKNCLWKSALSLEFLHKFPILF